MKHYIILTFLIFISTINRNGFLIADDIYPNDFHKLSDTYDMNSEVEPKKLLISKLEETVDHKIKGIDGDFKATRLEKTRSKLSSLKFDIYKIELKVNEIGKNESILKSDDFQSLQTLLEQTVFIDSSVEYISDLSDIYDMALKSKSDEPIKKSIASLIKKKSHSLFVKLIYWKSASKRKGVDYKEMKSQLLIPIFIEITDNYSKLMDETKLLYDLIPVEKDVIKKLQNSN